MTEAALLHRAASARISAEHAPEWDGSLAGLAIAVPVVDPGLSMLEVEDHFRRNETLRAVLTWHDDRWQLVSRAWCDQLLTGRYGYGRALHGHRPLYGHLPLETVSVSPASTLSEAAQTALNTGGQPLPELLVVDEGQPRVLPVASVFAALASIYRHAALTDPLTELPNRLAVHHFLQDNSAGLEVGTAVLYVDLDRFKEVNDTHGHRVGDSLLVEFAARLRGCLRQGDLVARLGGDEFVLLLRGVTEPRAAAVAERVILSAAAPFVLDGAIVSVSASVGLALPEDLGEHRQLTTGEVLLRRADLAMYRSKEAGRGR